MTTPTIHLNGTGFDTLWQGYEQADQKHREFTKAFGQIEFNARDYYVQGPDAWTQAVEQRQAICQKLRDIKDYLDAHRSALDSQNLQTTLPTAHCSPLPMPLIDYQLEQVSGTIIGGDYGVRAAVFYDGRPQDRQIFAADNSAAMTEAKAIKRRLIAEVSPSCYADDSLWELRIYHQ